MIPMASTSWSTPVITSSRGAARQTIANASLSSDGKRLSRRCATGVKYS